MVSFGRMIAEARASNPTTTRTPTHTTVLASNARLLALQRHPHYRCLCNTCHVTTGSLLIAYVQLALTFGLAIVISASLASSTPSDRTRVIRQFYDGQRGVFSRHQRRVSSSDVVTMEDSAFATFFAAVYMALVVEATISVCLLIGIKTERRWFLVPHLLTSLFSIISTSMRLFSVVSVSSSDRVLSAFLTISVEFLVFWVPYRAFVYMREKEKIVRHDARLRGTPFDGAIVIRANSNDAHVLAMAPPPSYSAAYAVPPAYKQMEDEATVSDPPPAYEAPIAQPLSEESAPPTFADQAVAVEPAPSSTDETQTANK